MSDGEQGLVMNKKQEDFPNNLSLKGVILYMQKEERRKYIVIYLHISRRNSVTYDNYRCVSGGKKINLRL
ncbi:UNVERIFIED_CONTAM: hypothetical protein NCL1_43840 [Trichonephila clavipes]